MPMQAHGTGGRIAPNHSQSRHWKGWVASSTPRLLYPRERERVTIVQEARWASESVWAVTVNLFSTGIRSLDCPACNELLYRLHYPGLYTLPCLKYSQQLHEIFRENKNL